MKIVNEVSSKKEQYGTVSAQVHDKHGNLLQDVEIPIDSFNRQMWREIQFNFSGVNSPLISLSNTSQNYNASFIAFTSDGVNNDYLGIVVGSGTNATTYNTVLMQTLIDFGTGNGQLFALPSTAEYDQSTRITTLTRSFISVNENSSPISINEVGITAAPIDIGTSSKSDVMLMVRDVLPSTLSIPYEGTLSVQYKLRIASGNNNYSNVFIRPYGTDRNTGQNLRQRLTNTNGIAVSLSQSSLNLRLVCDEGNTRRGLNFGTSTTAFDVTQVDLQGKIAHGNGASQLFYHPTSNTTIQENSTTNSCRFIFTRAVENRSGAPISINEVGIFVDGDLPTASQSFMLDRKILENTVTLQDTNIVTFWWEFCYEL